MLTVVKYFEPYNEQGKPRMGRKYATRSGVYFIKPKGRNKPVYVGSSNGNLKKTIYRHFQKWSSYGENRFDRTVYPKKGYEVKIIFAPFEQAYNLERTYIQKIRPKDNPIKYNLFNPPPATKRKVNMSWKNA